MAGRKQATMGRLAVDRLAVGRLAAGGLAIAVFALLLAGPIVAASVAGAAEAAKAATQPRASALDSGRPLMVGYYETWEEVQTPDPTQTRLARLPAAVDVVKIAFARPDMAYEGDYSLSKTGLGFPFQGRLARAAVDALKARNPKVKVLLSVGGAGYLGWDWLKPDAIAALVRDLNLDGVDVDFEPRDAGCRIAPGTGRIRCTVEPLFVSSIQKLRRALPRPLILSIAGWSVGAFGEGKWASQQPVSRYTGMVLGLLRSPAAADIDLISIMGYEAGPKYQPLAAYDAYKAHFDGPVALGFLTDEVVATPETFKRAEDTARAIAKKGGHVMVYSLQRQPPPAPAAEQAAQALCRGIRKDCDFTLP